jgi:hypothetical protein
MPVQPKPKKVGRPKLPKGEAKGKLVALRLSASDVKRIEAAAKVSKQTVSDWIRAAVNSALLQTLAISNQENGARSPESRRVRRELRAIGHRGGLRSDAI